MTDKRRPAAITVFEALKADSESPKKLSSMTKSVNYSRLGPQNELPTWPLSTSSPSSFYLIFH